MQEKAKILIQSILDRAVAAGETVGCSALIRKDGQELCFAASGLADREENKPIRRRHDLPALFHEQADHGRGRREAGRGGESSISPSPWRISCRPSAGSGWSCRTAASRPWIGP